MQFINIVNLFKKENNRACYHCCLIHLQHNIKKLRNNLEKSRPGGVRLLSYGDKTIQWSHIYQAYKWDQTRNSLKIHKQLPADHFKLEYATRMRNHLAEDVLSKKMLYLLQVKTHLCQIQYLYQYMVLVNIHILPSEYISS